MIFSGSLLRWFPSRSALDGRNISRLLVLCFPESPDPLKSGMDWTSDWLRCLSKSAAHSFWPGDVTATVVTISGKKQKKNPLKYIVIKNIVGQSELRWNTCNVFFINEQILHQFLWATNYQNLKRDKVKYRMKSLSLLINFALNHKIICQTKYY